MPRAVRSVVARAEPRVTERVCWPPSSVLAKSDVARFIELTMGHTPSEGLITAVHLETDRQSALRERPGPAPRSLERLRRTSHRQRPSEVELSERLHLWRQPQGSVRPPEPHRDGTQGPARS